MEIQNPEVSSKLSRKKKKEKIRITTQQIYRQ
jgi:hypothetical protein